MSGRNIERSEFEVYGNGGAAAMSILGTVVGEQCPESSRSFSVQRSQKSSSYWQNLERSRDPLYEGSSLISASGQLVPQPLCPRPRNTTQH